MNRLHHRLRLAVAALVVLGSSALAVATVTAAPAGATSASDNLVGEGGSFLSPVVNALEDSDSNQGAPYFTYQDTDVDAAIADFTGIATSAPGQLNADFAVTERPLTSAEAAGASANGRSFAYVPFAATPVAIVDMAFCHSPQITDPVVASDWCQYVKLTPTDVAEIIEGSYGVGAATNPLQNWGGLTQTDGDPIPSTQSFGFANVLGNQQENTALLTWIDSDTNAKAIFDNVLSASGFNIDNLTDTPSEIWPMQTQRSYAGGDEGMIEKEIDINPADNAPANAGQWLGLGSLTTPLTSGDAFPVSSVWTVAPEGTPWDLPTAALVNAAGHYVPPTEAAAVEAETGSNITLDPTTNLVTFNASTTDANAYNNDMMAESYLVVPTTGLPAAKADKLAQFIRYILGPEGQTVIKEYGAAPATTAEVTAGLSVAAQLSQEAAFGNAATGSISTTSSSSTTTTVAGGSSAASSASSGSSGGTSGAAAGSTTAADSSDSDGTGSAGTSTGNSGTGSGSDLAFTGSGALWPIGAVGAALFVFGVLRRRQLLRSRAAPALVEGEYAPTAHSDHSNGWRGAISWSSSLPSRLISSVTRKKVGP